MGVLTKKEIEWAYEKWCQGYTMLEIADALYVNERTVGRALKGKQKIRPILTYEWSEQ